jgi:hypothetical protein
MPTLSSLSNSVSVSLSRVSLVLSKIISNSPLLLVARIRYIVLRHHFANNLSNSLFIHLDPAGQAGAMGKGQQTATALTTFFQIWCYITPIIGAIVADQYLGKYRTILTFACIYFIGLVILTATTSPMGLEGGASFPGLLLVLILLSVSVLVVSRLTNSIDLRLLLSVPMLRVTVSLSLFKLSTKRSSTSFTGVLTSVLFLLLPLQNWRKKLVSRPLILYLL